MLKTLLLLASTAVSGTTMWSDSPDPYALVGALDAMAVNCNQVAGIKLDVEKILLLGIDVDALDQQRRRLAKLRSETRIDLAAKEKYQAAYSATIVGARKLTDVEITSVKSTCRAMLDVKF